MIIVINSNGKEMYYNAAILLMDGDTRKALQNRRPLLEPQELLTAYEETHLEKFGKPWEMSKAHPDWAKT